MSSLSAPSLCLFSAALCNIQILDQKLFDQAANQVGGNQQFNNQQGTGALINQATNLFNAFTGGFGGGNNNQNNNRPAQGQGQGQGQGQKPRSPHQSPCPNRFQYVTDGREWKGIMKLKNIDLNVDTLLEADFLIPTRAYQRSNNNYGRIELVNDGDSIYEDLQSGLPLLFEIIFASQNPIPKLVAIYKNGKQICNGHVENANGLRPFRLTYTLEAQASSLSGENADRFNLNGQVLQPAPAVQPQTQERPQQKPDVPRPNPSGQQFNQFQDDSAVCGIPVAGFTQSLVIGGQGAGHGEWPWLVAFYRSVNGNLEFICGASLISSSYSLTAAHCIQDKGKQAPMLTENALLFIGKHNLVQWNEEGYEKKGAKTFKVHPDWNPNDVKYDADIALIEMESAVRYSKFIRPICLWNGPVDLAEVVGKTGVVAGWGKNDEGKLNTDFPKKVNVPIVSDGQCLRTHEAFVHITSDRTFCAGGRMGEGPCQGDSGGGLVLKIGKKWFLRGIVSASLRDGTSCDVNSYAIFTDLAQFLPWLKSEM